MQGAEIPAEKLNITGKMLKPKEIYADAIDLPETNPIIDIEDIIGLDALYEKMMQCARNVRWKPSVGYCIHNYPMELQKLSQSLHDNTYKPHRPRYFEITEPKPRQIMSMYFRDRIYLRSLNDTGIYPYISKSLIKDNYACQKGKGTLKARERTRDFLRDFYRKHKTEGYRLQVDIHGYYPNMDKEYSYSVFRKRLPDEVYPRALQALQAHPGEIGYNPGDQTIQNVGISALDDLDHVIKEKLRIKRYIRYMDDFILMHKSKEYLEKCLEVIKKMLAEQKMTLNEKKTTIEPIAKPFLFLGFVYHLTDSGKVVVIPDPKKIKHEKRKLRRMAIHVNECKPIYKKRMAIYLTKHDVDVHFKTYKACIRFGNYLKTIQHLNRFYKSLWKGA